MNLIQAFKKFGERITTYIDGVMPKALSEIENDLYYPESKEFLCKITTSNCTYTYDGGDVCIGSHSCDLTEDVVEAINKIGDTYSLYIEYTYNGISGIFSNLTNPDDIYCLLGETSADGCLMLKPRTSGGFYFSQERYQTTAMPFIFSIYLVKNAKTIDSDCVDTTIPRINAAEVGQLVSVKSTDANGVPTEWESVDNFSGSWNDLEDKPFCEEEAEFDIIPEQTCVVTDGVITADSTQDLTSDYDGLTGYLVINDVVYEGTLSWFNVAWFYTGTFGDYEISNGEITLSENTSLNDGDEVTVRLYVNATQIETLDEKYLPSKYVSCETDQELTETQKTTARLNIGAMSKSAIEKIVILEDEEEVKLSSSSSEAIKVSLPDFLYTYDFDFLEIISQYRDVGSSDYNDIRILVPVKSNPSTYYTSYRQRIYSDEHITVVFFADCSGTPSIVISLTNDGRSSMRFDLQTINGYKLDINTTYIE